MSIMGLIKGKSVEGREERERERRAEAGVVLGPPLPRVQGVALSRV